MHELIGTDHEQRACPAIAPRDELGTVGRTADHANPHRTDPGRDANRPLASCEARDSHLCARIIRDDHRIELEQRGYLLALLGLEETEIQTQLRSGDRNWGGSKAAPARPVED